MSRFGKSTEIQIFVSTLEISQIGEVFNALADKLYAKSHSHRFL